MPRASAISGLSGMVVVEAMVDLPILVGDTVTTETFYTGKTDKNILSVPWMRKAKAKIDWSNVTINNQCLP